MRKFLTSDLSISGDFEQLWVYPIQKSGTMVLKGVNLVHNDKIRSNGLERSQWVHNDKIRYNCLEMSQLSTQ